MEVGKAEHAQDDPAWHYNASIGYSTPNHIPETTPDTQSHQPAVRGKNKCWRNGREGETEGYGNNEDRQNWRLQSSEEHLNVSNC